MEVGRPAARLKAWEVAVLGALLPSGASPRLGLGILDTGFADFLAEFDAVAPAGFRRIFRLGLLAAGWVAPLLIRRLPPLSRLPQADRERALAAMERSGLPELRQLLRVVKAVVSLHYGALPAVRQAIGYHP